MKNQFPEDDPDDLELDPDGIILRKNPKEKKWSTS